LTHRFDRTDALARLADETFDVLVVGGGITGAGVLLDAASRGLRTALVERGDFASGTSSKSSKLVHGGLRYLQQGDIALVYEALAERQRLLRNAPHLVNELPFVIPIYSKDGLVDARIERAFDAVMWGYDLTGGLRIGKRHRRINAEEVMERIPSLPREKIHSGYIYYDCEADDARLVLAVIRTAVLDHAAAAANRVSVVALKHDQGGPISGAVLRTAEGHELEVKTRAVVNATGVWADDIVSMAGPDQDVTLRPAKGIHLSLPSDRFNSRNAAVLPIPGDGRSIFLIPWNGVTYTGTTDTDYRGSLSEPRCTTEDVDYLLDGVRSATTANVSRADVVGVWAGLRPLVSEGAADSTADLSRRHSITTSDSGLVTVVGGKLTTYRRMAEDTIDVVLKHFGADFDRWVWRRCRTRRLPLRGSASDAGILPGIEPELADHLRGRYGSEAGVLAAMIENRPELADPLIPGLEYVKAEVIYSARFEMVNTLSDVLSRRTRARLKAAQDSADAAGPIAELLGDELGWTADRKAAEVAEYRLQVERDLECLAPAEMAL
jgi:glycerol-3-phosphate dehydrogenase